jgi:putative ABC transport system permease protein
MKLLDIIISANQSLLRNKARTTLTVIAIFIGATTLSLTNGIGSGIKAYLNKQVGNLGNSSSLTITAASKSSGGATSQNNGLTKYSPGEKKIASGTQGSSGQSQVALTQSDIDKIKTVPNIVSVTPSLSVTPDYIANASTPDAKYQFTISQTVGKSTLDMSNGRGVSNDNSVNEITIPTSYISSLGFKDNQSAVGQTINIGISDATGKQSEVTATITGVQQKTLVGSTAAYANNALFDTLYSTETTGLPASSKDAYASVSAIYKDGLSDTQISTLKSDLKAKGYDAKTVKDQVSTVFTVITAITYVFDGFAAITLVAAAFGIVNTLYMSVSERTKEIGLMKALGMGKRKIFLLFSIEAVLIGFWGSILGVGFANLIGKLVNSITSKGFLKDFTGLQLLSFPLVPSTIIVVGIMLIAFLAGTLPARRASQKDPIEALRYE